MALMCAGWGSIPRIACTLTVVERCRGSNGVMQTLDCGHLQKHHKWLKLRHSVAALETRGAIVYDGACAE